MALPKEVKFVTFDCYGTLIDWETGRLRRIPEGGRPRRLHDRPRRADPAVHRHPARDPARLVRALRRGPAPHGGARGRGAGLGARALALELPARQRAALAALPRDQRPARALRQEVRDRASSRTSTTSCSAPRGATSASDFDLVVTAQQVRSYKPDPAHFKECAAADRAAKKNWVHIASRLPDRHRAVHQAEDPGDLGQPPRRGARGRARRSPTRRSRPSATPASCSSAA